MSPLRLTEREWGIRGESQFYRNDEERELMLNKQHWHLFIRGNAKINF